MTPFTQKITSYLKEADEWLNKVWKITVSSNRSLNSKEKDKEWERRANPVVNLVLWTSIFERLSFCLPRSKCYAQKAKHGAKYILNHFTWHLHDNLISSSHPCADKGSLLTPQLTIYSHPCLSHERCTTIIGQSLLFLQHGFICYFCKRSHTVGSPMPE